MTEGNNQNKAFKRRVKRNYPAAFIHEPLCHPDNKDLRLHYDFLYDGFPVMTLRGPLVEPYIKALVQQVGKVYSTLPKVFALRVDLYFPKDWSEARCLNTEASEAGQIAFSKDYFTRFIESLKSKLNAYYSATGKLDQKRSLPLYFCRTYEAGRSNYNRGVHIHVLLMTNGHAFQSKGDYVSKKGLQKRTIATMVREAWASALFGYDQKNQGYEADDWRSKIPNFKNVERVFDEGLVYFGRAWSDRNRKGDDPIYNHFENLHDVVFVASYLCKADSKLISKGRHPFSTSSRKAFPKASPKAEIMPFIDKVKPSQAEEAKYDAFQAKGVRIPGHGSLLLDDIEAKYLEQDISDVLDYLAKKIEVSPDFVAVRFTLEIDDGFLRLRERFEYFEKFYRRLEATMRYKLGHEGKTKSTDISHLKAFNTVQKEGRQYLIHGVLLIEGKVFDQVFESDDDNYLHAYLAEEATYTYGLGISEAEQRLEIKSVHRLNSRHARFESISHSLHQHIAELCFAERSASMGSTLYLR